MPSELLLTPTCVESVLQVLFVPTMEAVVPLDCYLEERKDVLLAPFVPRMEFELQAVPTEGALVAQMISLESVQPKEGVLVVPTISLDWVQPTAATAEVWVEVPMEPRPCEVKERSPLVALTAPLLREKQ